VRVAAAALEQPRSESFVALTVRRFRKHRLAVAGLGVLVVLGLAAALAPLIAPYTFTHQDYSQLLKPPSWHHLMGTDDVGSDEFTRILYGARISLLVGLLAMAVAVVTGAVLGAVAGYFGGLCDAVIMRAVDVALSIPSLFLLLILTAIVPPSTTVVILAIGLTRWMAPTRIVRSEFLSLREREFVEAARALGQRPWAIIFREILPNAMGPLIVNATLMVGQAIISESVLSWLGMGIQPPTPSWGNMLTGAQSYIWDAPWMAIFPGLMILITVLAFNLVGDGLRDALDPKALR
jgi:peptide/nickel transport system permease protein